MSDAQWALSAAINAGLWVIAVALWAMAFQVRDVARELRRWSMDRDDADAPAEIVAPCPEVKGPCERARLKMGIKRA